MHFPCAVWTDYLPLPLKDYNSKDEGDGDDETVIRNGSTTASRGSIDLCDIIAHFFIIRDEVIGDCETEWHVLKGVSGVVGQ